MGLDLSRPGRETSEGCLGFVGGMKKTLDRSALQLEALCPGLGRPGLCTHTHHRLGWTSASPRPSPSLLGKGCSCHWNLLPCEACCHAHLNVEGGSCGDHSSVSWARGCREVEVQWDPKAGRASTSLHRSGALEAEWGGGRRRRGRRLAGAGPFSTFSEHPLGPGLSEVTGTRQPCSHGAPRGVGAVCLWASQRKGFPEEETLHGSLVGQRESPPYHSDVPHPENISSMSLGRGQAEAPSWKALGQ